MLPKHYVSYVINISTSHYLVACMYQDNYNFHLCTIHVGTSLIRPKSLCDGGVHDTIIKNRLLAVLPI